MTRGGALLGGRFEIEERVASGAVGVVYRAIDRDTGARVAVKMLHRIDDAQRFALEAKVLQELRHPGIVGYVGHGVHGGAPYLVTEWLAGEDLAARLARVGMRRDDAVRLAAAVAEALAAAHERGVVHRDVKPANIFLPDGDLGRPKLIDFGLARVVAERAGETRPGARVGTPAYMSPEQARGEQADARSDLFSLGCVLFECLAGRPPFGGDSALAVMAKILFEEAPRLGALLGGAMPALDELCAALLEKARAARPADARGVALRLRAVEGGVDIAPPSSPPAAVSASENRLVCLLLARASQGGPERVATLRRAVEPHGLHIDSMLDGALACQARGSAEAADLCARTARCALSLLAADPGAAVAIATGRASAGGTLAVGDVIDRAALLLAGGGAAGRIALDPLSAELLDAAFHVAGGDGGRALLDGERNPLQGPRRLLGRATPCVGREDELASLLAVAGDCERRARGRAALVVGEAGAGKSRLVQELLARLGGRFEVWAARGDPVAQGTPLGLVAQLVRRAAGLRDREPAGEPLHRLRVAALRLRVADPARVAMFLAELVGAPGSADDTRLRAARAEPQLMADQLRRAWEDLVQAAAAARPLALVVEDLHWGDAAAVDFLGGALRRAQAPLLVVASARPAIDARFPAPWADQGAVRVALRPLPEAAAAELVRRVLGDRIADARVHHLIERAGGNAFCLEELIRADAAGGGDTSPASVVAIAQARLEGLRELPRRVVRAASLLGERFHAAALAPLLGDEVGPDSLAAALVELVESDILLRERAGGDDELAFRHAILREAAYAMLAEHDRVAGHRVVASMMAQAGGGDALVVAHHFDRGAEPARAAPWYARAAEQALAATDLAAAIAHAELALRCGARGADQASARLAQATAHHWRAEYDRCERAAVAALRSLPPLSPAWYRAAGEIAEASLPLGKLDSLAALGEALHAPPGGRAARESFVVAGATAAMQLALGGRGDDAAPLLDRVEHALAGLDDAPPHVRARVSFARATRAAVAGDLGAVLAPAGEAITLYERAGDLRNAALMRTNLASAFADLGGYVEAEAELRGALAAAEALGLAKVAGFARENLGLALARQGRLDEALGVETEALAALEAMEDAPNVAVARCYLAGILAARGDLVGADAQARAAVEGVPANTPVRCFALATLATVLLTANRPEPALAAATDAIDLLGALGSIDEGESLVRLAHARSLAACGRGDDGHRAAAAARDRLFERAARVSDERWRASFLANVPECAQTLALAGEATRSPS